MLCCILGLELYYIFGILGACHHCIVTAIMDEWAWFKARFPKEWECMNIFKAESEVVMSGEKHKYGKEQ